MVTNTYYMISKKVRIFVKQGIIGIAERENNLL